MSHRRITSPRSSGRFSRTRGLNSQQQNMQESGSAGLT